MAAPCDFRIRCLPSLKLKVYRQGEVYTNWFVFIFSGYPFCAAYHTYGLVIKSIAGVAYSHSRFIIGFITVTFVCCYTIEFFL